MANPLRIVKLLDAINNVVVTGGLVPKGAYNGSVDYQVGDFVSFNSNSYVMWSDAGAGTVPSNASYWMLVAAHGADGSNASNGNVPAGGTTGQLLSKASSTDFDTVWIDDNSIAYAIALG